jgi:acyl-CoA reductase-like NAD-dependent aldehyde dehydrogenase
MSEEIPPMLRPDPLLRGRGAAAGGQATGEYMRGFTSSIRREPIGVIGSVTPWNYPMMMAVWKFAPALAAGNTLVLKPSDTTPASTVYMAELFADILPPGVFNVVCGDRDTGAQVVSHPIPEMVSITGASGPARRSHARRPTRSSAATSSSAARHRSSSSTTRTSARRRRTSPSPGTSTRGRTARPPRACSRPNA